MRPILLLLAIPATTTSCAEYSGAAAGPVVATAAEDARPSAGIAVEIGHGKGNARDDGSGASFLDARARLTVMVPRQQIAVLFGASEVSWQGTRTPLWYGLGLGPAIERTRDNGFFEAVAQLRLGSGFVLHESFGPAPWPPMGNPWEPWKEEPRRELRKRRVLTLGMTADIDARFTRWPLLMMGLTVGITSFEEIILGPDQHRLR